MTVIAAVVKNGRAAIACDSQVSGGGKGRMLETKVVEFGPNSGGGLFGSSAWGYIGVCGSAEAFLVLRGLQGPRDGSEGAWAELLDEACRALRELAAEGPRSWSQYLAVTKNSIHDVNPHGVFQVSPGDKIRLGAVGSGGGVALGRMKEFAERYVPWTPAQAVEAGVKAAIDLAEGCGGKINVYRL